jgi:hypothetical protein
MFLVSIIYSLYAPPLFVFKDNDQDSILGLI